jgi:hypothetical protein
MEGEEDLNYRAIRAHSHVYRLLHQFRAIYVYSRALRASEGIVLGFVASEGAEKEEQTMSERK